MTEADARCARVATHITATGRRYCAQHAASLNTGRPTGRQVARRLALGWAQATGKTGRPLSDTWHAFEETGFEGIDGEWKSLCGQRYPAVGPRRQIKPLDARDPDICYYCRMVILGQAVDAKTKALKPTGTAR